MGELQERRRARQVNVRYSDEEYEQLAAVAQNRGMSVADIVRQATLEEERLKADTYEIFKRAIQDGYKDGYEQGVKQLDTFQEKLIAQVTEDRVKIWETTAKKGYMDGFAAGQASATEELKAALAAAKGMVVEAAVAAKG